MSTFNIIKYDITTIGTAAIDTFLELADVCYQKNQKKKTDYYCFPIGSKVLIKNLQEYIGGNAANTAVGFSRLNLKTTILTSLGTDRLSREIINHLKKEGVETKFIKINKKIGANLSYILDWHKDKNDRVILSYHQSKNFKKLKLPKTQWIYLTSLGEYYNQVIKQLPSKAKIAWNPGGLEISKGLKYLLPFLNKVEILILNKDEAAHLLNLHVRQSQNYKFLLTNLLKLGVATVVITAGPKGAYAKQFNQKEFAFVPALKIKPQEVTGAGDAFAVGFVAAYIKKKALVECLRWGVVNASSCIKHIGAQNGLLKLRVLKQRYKKYYK